MSYFTTISPTCVYGEKRAAWERFRTGGYIAVGWCYDTDLTGMSIEEILPLVEATADPETPNDAKDGRRSFPNFWELCQGYKLDRRDYVAVRNGNDGLFGVGYVKSGYKYSRHKHFTGKPAHYYPHYLEVEWVWTEYIQRISLDFGGETSWQPYGTMPQLYYSLPSYILKYI